MLGIGLVAAVVLQQLEDPVGEEGADAEVQDFFLRLVLQDQDVAGLDQRPRFGIVDCAVQVHGDVDLAFAG